MPVKHILAPVSGDHESQHVFMSALNLAEELDAHVTATNIPIPASAYVIPEMAVSLAAYGGLQKTFDDVNVRRAARARQDFDRAVAVTKTAIVDTPVCARASTTWIDAARLPNGAVETLGRCADLVAVALPGDDSSFAEMEIFEDAIFGAACSALVVPNGIHRIARDNFAVAWNGSTEAVAAVKCMLSLAKPDAKITVIQVGDLRRGRIPAETLMDYLGWHCLAPTLRKVADQPHATTEVLIQEAKAASADLLVVGAYSRSRTREMLWGGVTRRLLTGSDLPLLMAHS
jgi:nucleotide-binding universal stress UspA family protein